MQIARPSSLATLRRINERNLPSQAVVLAPTITDGPGGTSTTAWNPAGNPWPCRLSAISGSGEEIALAEQLRAVPAFVVVFAAGAPVDTAQRLKVFGETLGVPWSRTLDVVGVAAPKSVESMRKVYVTAVIEEEVAVATSRRLLEDGSLRLLEDGSARFLEAA